MEDSITGTSLSAKDRESLRRAATWARFLGIVGFVFSGLMVFTALAMGSLFKWILSVQRQAALEQMEVRNLDAMLDDIGILYTAMFLLSAALYFVPALLLYQFATRTLRATATMLDGATLSSAWEAQRRLYKFMGILTIIVLGLYALAFLGALIMVGMSAMFA